MAALAKWLKVFDAVSTVAQMTGRFRKGDAIEPSPLGAPGQLEARLAGVVVAALKEAFDRDRVRMDLERAQLDAERQRAEEALRAELRRHAADRAVGRLRLVAVMAITIWVVSAALGAWLPGMRAGAAWWLLAAGWLCVLGTLGGAFAGWQRVERWSSSSVSATTPLDPGAGERMASWLLLGALALTAAALLSGL